MVNNNSRGPTPAQYCALRKVTHPMIQREQSNRLRHGTYGQSLMKPSSVRTLPTARRQPTNALLFGTRAMNLAEPKCNAVRASYLKSNKLQKNHNNKEKIKHLNLQRAAREITKSGIFPPLALREIFKRRNVRRTTHSPSSKKQPNKTFFGVRLQKPKSKKRKKTKKKKRTLK